MSGCGVTVTALQLREETRNRPAPWPCPVGRGRIARRACANPKRLDSSQRGWRCSLSLRGFIDSSRAHWYSGRSFPLTPPSPLGRIARCCVANRTRWVVQVSGRSIAERTVPVEATPDLSKTQDAGSLSQREGEVKLTAC